MIKFSKMKKILTKKGFFRKKRTLEEIIKYCSKKNDIMYTNEVVQIILEGFIENVIDIKFCELNNKNENKHKIELVGSWLTINITVTKDNIKGEIGGVFSKDEEYTEELFDYKYVIFLEFTYNNHTEKIETTYCSNFIKDIDKQIINEFYKKIELKFLTNKIKLKALFRKEGI